MRTSRQTHEELGKQSGEVGTKQVRLDSAEGGVRMPKLRASGFARAPESSGAAVLAERSGGSSAFRAALLAGRVCPGRQAGCRQLGRREQRGVTCRKGLRAGDVVSRVVEGSSVRRFAQRVDNILSKTV